ncbi:MAG: mechanosensitive ion channel domain-containing protein [Bacteroidota bacterium]
MYNQIYNIDSPLLELILVIASLLAALLVGSILFYFLKKVGVNFGIERNAIRKIYHPLLLVIFMMFISGLLIYERVWFDQLKHILFVLSGAWLLIQLVAVGRIVLISQYNIETEDNLQARKVFTQVRVFERIAIVLIVILALGLALITFDSIRRIGLSLLTSAGIAGIIIGLAAQKLIGNILAGLQIAITQPIRIDDVVVVENEWGRIEEITLTYVVVNIWDKRRLVVPATYFIEKPFQNWTRSTAEILGTVFIYTDYRMPVEQVRDQLTKILESTTLWDKKVNVVQVTNADKTTVELRALVSAKDSPTAWDLRVLVREKLIAFLQEEYPEMLPKTRIEVEKVSNSGD